MGGPLAGGIGLVLLAGLLTFGLNKRLPYRKMLVVTGVMLGVVLLVMVGEQGQEMQLAGWLPTTPVARLQGVIPSWMQLWFAVFPTTETLALQALVAAIVIGSYVLAERKARA